MTLEPTAKISRSTSPGSSFSHSFSPRYHAAEAPTGPPPTTIRSFHTGSAAALDRARRCCRAARSLLPPAERPAAAWSSDGLARAFRQAAPPIALGQHLFMQGTEMWFGAVEAGDPD